MVGDGHVNDPSTVVREDDEHEEHSERVGTTKKSTAMICLAWFARNVRHVCDGGRGCRRMYLAIGDWLTETPNF
jgi:hypothetical protein